MPTRFSVIIPVHNRAEVIGRAVSSVLAQTFASFEVIVVDAGSTDESVAAARAVADDRVRVLRQAESDIDTARYGGSTKARGEWITFLNPDDEVRSDWLSRLGKLIDANNAALVSCGGHECYLDASTSEILPQRIGFPGMSGIASIRSGAFAVQRHLLQSVPYWNSPTTRGSFSQLAVHLINEVLAESGAIVATPESLVSWNEPSLEDQYSGDELRLRLALQAIDSLARTPIPDGDLLCQYATIGGVAASRLRQHRLARHLFRIALRSTPEHRKLWARYFVSCIPVVARRVWQPTPELPVETGDMVSPVSTSVPITDVNALADDSDLQDERQHVGNDDLTDRGDYVFERTRATKRTRRRVVAATNGAQPPSSDLNGHPSQSSTSSVQLIEPASPNG